ncbi:MULTISPECIES: hypothetical protein [Rhizobium/Agrobacterium group]|uniref:hypothetical protein n=2 Tax=Rhizobium/Agrobacterium group TaxID=227290 RepID=UPI001177FA5B|nr:MULTISPECIES: hypothetical protein [Rhizobium/Agrobacterium group]NSZ43054.1 hypothetical protein [Agrobacterium vitis]NTA26711.1 hypothetical protein [Allorhizobium ampelinum]
MPLVRSLRSEADHNDGPLCILRQPYPLDTKYSINSVFMPEQMAAARQKNSQGYPRGQSVEAMTVSNLMMFADLNRPRRHLGSAAAATINSLTLPAGKRKSWSVSKI